MNDRHIKLKDAIEVVRETVADKYIEGTLKLRLLDKSLPADVRENVSGEWIRNDNGTYSCSVCQAWIPEEQHYYARYCLHCGAEMGGKS